MAKKTTAAKRRPSPKAKAKNVTTSAYPSQKPLTFWHGLAFFVIIQAFSALSGIASREQLFDGFVKAPLTPPGWVFPIVWTTLVILQITALVRTWNRPKLPRRSLLLGLQAWMWLLYVSFTPAYFGLNSPTLGFIIVVCYWLAALLSIRFLWQTNRPTALLLLPLLAWLSLAFFLSGYGMLHNPDPFLGTAAWCPMPQG